MKTEKVFDCQEMPEGVKKAFFDWYKKGDPIGNSVFVRWHTEMWTEEAEAAGSWGMSLENAKLFHKVNNWLLKNGMNPKEDVLIQHWW
jgi:hypothetical protein